MRTEMNLYTSLFEDDDLDDMKIEPQERDMHGNTVEYPDLDVLNEAPYEEAKDTIIGTKFQLSHPSGVLKKPLSNPVNGITMVYCLVGLMITQC